MDTTTRMPALFAGHDSIARASATTAVRRCWQDVAAHFPQPRAVVCVAAQWQTEGICISIAPEHESPHVLQTVSARVARRINGLLDLPGARLDSSHALNDEVVALVQGLYPHASIPVVQVSLDTALSPLEHAALGAWLRPLREQGILILGIGSMVAGNRTAYAAQLRELVGHGNIAALAELQALQHDAAAFLPLLYTLAVRADGDSVQLFDEVCEGTPSTSVLLRPDPLPRC
ncbi:hypothetical protein [Stenotrophomonas sp.]|uniref:dioxygenase family protein n=1 Tax=Stenotrophomonas sp. TaxID=69392 RepID=UPI00289F1C1E|nr:hypothetical protein [Stenotrophomonas sp.]